jgi:hypothetical protein
MFLTISKEFIIDKALGGDFGRNFPIGSSVFR